jgi:hypothetical protein
MKPFQTNNSNSYSFFICAISLFLLEYTPSVAAKDNEVQVTFKDIKRSINPNRDKIEKILTMDSVKLTYSATIDAKNNSLVGGAGNLGLSFENAFWNPFHFMHITLQIPSNSKHKYISAFSSPLDDIHILERGKRGVVDLVWELPTTPDNFGEKKNGRMVMRIIKLPEYKDWFFMRLTIDSSIPNIINNIRISCYPSCSSGPMERRRWITTLTESLQGMEPYSASDNRAFCFHNRYAQERAGCFLILEPKETAKVTVGGTYTCGIILSPCRNEKTFHFAFGCFYDAPWQQAIDDFRRQAPMLQNILKSLNWNTDLHNIQYELKLFHENCVAETEKYRSIIPIDSKSMTTIKNLIISTILFASRLRIKHL